MSPRALIVALSLGLLTACGSQVSSEIPTSPTPGETNTPEPSPQPTPDTGNGQDGAITIDLDRTINTCHVVMQSGSQTLQLDAISGLEVGDRILVLQMQDTFAVSGATAAITNAGRAGAADIRRITSIDTTFVDVDEPLSVSFATDANGTAQACHVPEYTDVTVTSAGRILADPWDGSTGGVIAFYANGVTTLDGSIDASETGFRGGVAVGNSDNANVTNEDTNQNNGGGKGEGLDPAGFALFGRGSFANAGGGGNAHNTGGGGGGNGGAGGIGGDQPASSGSNPNTVGRGGGNVQLDSSMLTFGGGGGAGHQNGSLAGAGGAGGGILWMTVNDFIGAGAIASNGARGGDSGSAASSDGAGGGGAGGTVVVRAVTYSHTGLIEAIGGTGGDSLETDPHAPGGGGGGGRVMLADVPEAAARTSPGPAGKASNGGAHGALDGNAGTITVLGSIEP